MLVASKTPYRHLDFRRRLEGSSLVSFEVLF